MFRITKVKDDKTSVEYLTIAKSSTNSIKSTAILANKIINPANPTESQKVNVVFDNLYNCLNLIRVIVAQYE
jgi:hypothetical protein